MSKLKFGDKVVIVKKSDICSVSLVVGKVYIFNRYNKFDDDILVLEDEVRNYYSLFLKYGGLLTTEEIYNSPLYKIMREANE